MEPNFPDLRISHIVACAHDGVIGRGGALPWHIPEDFRLFKRTTMGHAMIMGRKTFESIGKALPGRLSVVVTNSPGWSAPDVVVCASLAQALAHCNAVCATWGSEVFIIGGGMLYATTMAIVDTIYMTVVDLAVAGDTFYPELPLNQFRLVHEQPGAGVPAFTWRIYQRSL